YSLYVMFYPQLVAGPIERPQNILHQFHEKHDYDFEQVKSGLMQMAFGMFKKVVIADRLAIVVDQVYARPTEQNGLAVVVACFFYAFQIYCDFSGYCDIGIGAARVMGFRLMDNFNMPYISKTIGEFWSRWHISLSTWFRDYLYIPLGGNRVSATRRFFNLFVVFLISGLWHGASWTFVIWGAVHGMYMVAGILKAKVYKSLGYVQNNGMLSSSFQTITTFLLVCFAWIFFRSPDMVTARAIIKKIPSIKITDQLGNLASGPALIFSLLLIAGLLAKEKYYPILPTKRTPFFYLQFILLIMLCYFFGVFNQQQFIYFQF
ncbi:MAG: MBOAT family protein, partial [Sphingobacteriales bacterium]